MPLLTEIRDVREINEAVNLQRFWRRPQQQGLATGDPTERFRPLSLPDPYGRRGSDTDIPEMNQKTMQEIALFLYQTNPLAHRFIDLMTEYVIGDGVTVTADDENLLGYLRAFWEHPENSLDERLPLLISDAGIYGEILLVLSFEGNGLMRIAYVSAPHIQEIKPSLNDLGKMKEAVLEEGFVSKGTKELKLIHLDPNGLRTGDASLLQLNKAADATRGLSDLLPLADIIGNLDLFVFNTVERAGHMMSWFWDILYQGANQEQLNEYIRQIHEEGTYPGQMRVHNEKVTWDAKTPNLQSADTERIFQTLFSYNVTGAGIPPHWTGVGGGVARSGTEPSQEPAYKRLIRRQAQVRRFLKEILNYQIDHLRKVGKLRKDEAYSFNVEMPKIAVRDFQRLGGSFARIIQALTMAVDAGLMEKERAAAVSNHVTQYLMEG